MAKEMPVCHADEYHPTTSPGYDNVYGAVIMPLPLSEYTRLT